MEYSDYDKARIELCDRLKHDLEGLELVAKMDTYVCNLQEDYENLDPSGEK